MPSIKPLEAYLSLVCGIAFRIVLMSNIKTKVVSVLMVAYKIIHNNWLKPSYPSLFFIYSYVKYMVFLFYIVSVCR